MRIRKIAGGVGEIRGVRRPPTGGPEMLPTSPNNVWSLISAAGPWIGQIAPFPLAKLGTGTSASATRLGSLSPVRIIFARSGDPMTQLVEALDQEQSDPHWLRAHSPKASKSGLAVGYSRRQASRSAASVAAVVQLLNRYPKGST